MLYVALSRSPLSMIPTFRRLRFGESPHNPFHIFLGHKDTRLFDLCPYRQSEHFFGQKGRRTYNTCHACRTLDLRVYPTHPRAAYHPSHPSCTQCPAVVAGHCVFSVLHETNHVVYVVTHTTHTGEGLEGRRWTLRHSDGIIFSPSAPPPAHRCSCVLR